MAVEQADIISINVAELAAIEWFLTFFLSNKVNLDMQPAFKQVSSKEYAVFMEDCIHCLWVPLMCPISNTLAVGEVLNQFAQDSKEKYEENRCTKELRAEHWDVIWAPLTEFFSLGNIQDGHK